MQYKNSPIFHYQKDSVIFQQIYTWMKKVLLVHIFLILIQFVQPFSSNLILQI
jgi:hypothetical protein